MTADAATWAGLIASILAIMTTIVLCARWLAKRFDKWIATVVENSKCIRDLSSRVTRLEGTIRNGGTRTDSR